MSVLIGADFVPTKENESVFKSGSRQELCGPELISVLREADLRVFNLEVPLCDSLSPTKKNGPNLIASTDTINGYKALWADVVTVANNHILDQGIQGLESTIHTLETNGIYYFGAVINDSEASKPFITETHGHILGFYGCAEHEFSIATGNQGGANPFDPIESLYQIRTVRKTVDYLVVFYHGGKEYYRYPSPGLQRICRAIVDAGADLVLCQHTHCVGCKESYMNSTIVYGQGNFLFNLNRDEYWKSGLLVRINDDLALIISLSFKP